MMTAHENLLAPTDRMLRQFAGLWIVFFAGTAAYQHLHHGRTGVAIGVAVAALTIGPLGLLRPRAVRPIFVGWMMLAYPIGWLVSRVILGVLFYGLFTPFAVIFRLTGRDALALKPKPEAPTYWDRKPAAPDSLQYLRPF
jgi:hypothetical protein